MTVTGDTFKPNTHARALMKQLSQDDLGLHDEALGIVEDDVDSSEGSNSSNNSGSHSGSGTSMTSSRTGLTKQQEIEIAKAETVAVFRLRLVVVAVLLLSAAGIAYAVHYVSSSAEQQEFENKYMDDSTKIFETVASNLDLTLGALDNFVVGVVSLAKFAGLTWPFVTVPDFAIRARKMQSISKAAVIQQMHYVAQKDRRMWELYTLANAGWVEEGIEIQKHDEQFKGNFVDEYETYPVVWNSDGIVPYNLTEHAVKWQMAPVVPAPYPPYNLDVFSMEEAKNAWPIFSKEKGVVINQIANIPRETMQEGGQGWLLSSEGVDFWNGWIKDFVGTEDDHTEPYSDMWYPILESFTDNVTNPGEPQEQVVGTVVVSYYWRDLLREILPQGSDGIIVVVENSCDQKFSYQINGPDTVYLGPDDYHDPEYNAFLRQVKLNDLERVFTAGRRSYSGLPLCSLGCQYTMYTYASSTMKEAYQTNQPMIFTLATVIVFLFTSAIFMIYDWLVERRQRMVMNSALRSNAIVSSLFPSNVRDRLFNASPEANNSAGRTEATKSRLHAFLHKDNKGADSGDITEAKIPDVSKPIADLFPDCTVMFCDICGFTAWSSVREPAQVFTLLETIYGAFDKVADRRKVFKVETIGDSYVAVVGLPEPRSDHALVMSKFAADCREQFSLLTRNLESKLGPETADLSMRFGLHSGPVTAGVLRGQKSRFQLFGDTVNTASRMESTGRSNQIHISQTTADCLIQAGKKSWVRSREDQVTAKGKGVLQTYWVEPKNNRASSVFSVPSFPNTSVRTGSSDGDEETNMALLMKRAGGVEVVDHEKEERMIDWNVEVLSKFIRQIIARRKASKKSIIKRNSKTKPDWNQGQDENRNVLDEVKEIIELPGFDSSTDNTKSEEDLVFAPLDETVADQLRGYVTNIARMYHNNPFHCFDHASHVTMSVVKLMNRIKSADAVAEKEQENIASALHDHTYGITSDPLTQFACIFSALIHDVDHKGVPNTQLVKEDTVEAREYKGRSVAEQNSVDIAWNLLTQSEYEDLRRAICETDAECQRFRQLVVNAVMATDIMDKELKNLRNGRWEKAFNKSTIEEADKDHVNRKATIVIEHLIQASDVAHTMQHWHVYRKWNEKLFEEMYLAYRSGRCEKDPTDFWYKGELGFFDFYIIPLAKKLSECGVFGVSSDEYLNYAMKNREEWAIRGQDIIKVMGMSIKARVAK